MGLGVPRDMTIRSARRALSLPSARIQLSKITSIQTFLIIIALESDLVS